MGHKLTLPLHKAVDGGGLEEVRAALLRHPRDIDCLDSEVRCCSVTPGMLTTSTAR